jgi:glycosyltransferase involved in cell wall biosynthesis
VCNEIKQGHPFYPLMKEVNFVNLDGSERKKQYPQIKKIVREITRPLRKTILHPLFPDPVELQKTQEFGVRFRNVVRDTEPEVIISYFLDDHHRIVKTMGHDRPLMVMHHNNSHFELLDEPNYKLQSLRHCDCLQLLLPSYEKIVQAALPWVRIRVIPNVVPSVEDGNLANPGEYKNEHIITMFGRLNKQHKQQHFLIRAFSYLAKEYPQWKVHLYGGHARPKDYENYLKTLIQKFNLENQVFLMGTTDKPLDILRKSDIFAFPTAFEGFPLALTEAMSVGLPCVGLKTTTAVNELIVDGYNGFLSDNNEADFAKKLKRLMDEPQLRVTLGRNGHESVKQYEPTKIWDQWENLIEETVQRFRQREAA